MSIFVYYHYIKVYWNNRVSLTLFLKKKWRHNGIKLHPIQANPHTCPAHQSYLNLNTMLTDIRKKLIKSTRVMILTLWFWFWFWFRFRFRFWFWFRFWFGFRFWFWLGSCRFWCTKTYIQHYSSEPNLKQIFRFFYNYLRNKIDVHHHIGVCIHYRCNRI